MINQNHHIQPSVDYTLNQLFKKNQQHKPCRDVKNEEDFLRYDIASDLEGVPEPLENKINVILGSKREDRFRTSFFKLVQKTGQVRVKSAPFMVPDL